MSWLIELLSDPSSFSHGMIVYSAVIALGLVLARLKFMGVSLGTTWVLFLGLILSYAGLEVNPDLLSFFKNFGLILFVFFIGMQVGPSFFATFRNGGWGLNGLMLLGIGLSIAVTLILFALFSGTVTLPEILGVHFGAITSTPGLGATQEALHAMGNNTDITVGYACAYPLAILGMIAMILFLKKIFRVSIEEEDRRWAEQQKKFSPAPIYYHVTVTNKALDGLTIREIRDLVNQAFICSRILHGGVITSPTADTKIYLGDKLRIVSNKPAKASVVAFCGEEDAQIDLATEHSPLVSQSIRVTRRSMNGVRIEQLHLSHMDGVNITRVMRSGVQFFPYNSLRLQLGDRLFCVGPKNSIARLEALMGNQSRFLDRPNVVAIFLGILLGVILGNLPIVVPGMPAPIRLGLAGGPLIAAILLSHFGPRLHLITYTTNSANLMLREWGISFFLASVGLAAGPKFFDALVNGNGLLYVGLGLAITLIPLFIMGVIGRKFMKLNFHTIAGLIAGTTTSTTVLTFASSLSEKSTAVIAYSNVYPLAMFIRIISGQVILVLFWSFV